MNVVILCKAVCITISEVVNKSGKHVRRVHLSEVLVEVVDQWTNLVDGVVIWLPMRSRVALFTWRKVRMSMNLFLDIKELQNCCENSTTLSQLTTCFQGRQQLLQL